MRKTFPILFILLTLLNCNAQKKKSKKNVQPEKQNETVDKTNSFPLISDLYADQTPEWLKAKNSNLNEKLGEYKTSDIESYNVINDSLTFCIYKITDDNCLFNTLITYINQKEKSQIEIGTNCDFDLSLTTHTWKKYYLLNSNTLKTIEYTETAPDSLIDSNGYLKSGYDFLEIKKQTDSVISIYSIKNNGLIDKKNK